MNEFLIGGAIRQARHLTQEQLGELVGVKKAQISKIENGCNVTQHHNEIVQYIGYKGGT